jgi:hypothetical protein
MFRYPVRYLLLAILLSGCRTPDALYRAAGNQQIACMNRVLSDEGLTNDEMMIMTRECHHVWKIQTGENE